MGVRRRGLLAITVVLSGSLSGCALINRVTVPTHCGVHSVWLADELWLADPPLGDHNPPPGWPDNKAPGWFIRSASGQGQFWSDGGQTARFRSAQPGTADPNAGCE